MPVINPPSSGREVEGESWVPRWVESIPTGPIQSSAPGVGPQQHQTLSLSREVRVLRGGDSGLRVNGTTGQDRIQLGAEILRPMDHQERQGTGREGRGISQSIMERMGLQVSI